jgi:hypothetical protein
LIACLVNSQMPRKYWNTLKMRSKAEGAQASLDEIVVIPLRSADSCLRETDTARSETILRTPPKLSSVVALKGSNLGEGLLVQGSVKRSQI